QRPTPSARPRKARSVGLAMPEGPARHGVAAKYVDARPGRSAGRLLPKGSPLLAEKPRVRQPRERMDHRFAIVLSLFAILLSGAPCHQPAPDARNDRSATTARRSPRAAPSACSSSEPMQARRNDSSPSGFG